MRCGAVQGALDSRPRQLCPLQGSCPVWQRLGRNDTNAATHCNHPTPTRRQPGFDTSYRQAAGVDIPMTRGAFHQSSTLVVSWDIASVGLGWDRDRARDIENQRRSLQPRLEPELWQQAAKRGRQEEEAAGSKQAAGSQGSSIRGTGDSWQESTTHGGPELLKANPFLDVAPVAASSEYSSLPGIPGHLSSHNPSNAARKMGAVFPSHSGVKLPGPLPCHRQF